jgi:hypothetical protein
LTFGNALDLGFDLVLKFILACRSLPIGFLGSLPVRERLAPPQVRPAVENALHRG